MKYCYQYFSELRLQSFCSHLRMVVLHDFGKFKAASYNWENGIGCSSNGLSRKQNFFWPSQWALFLQAPLSDSSRIRVYHGWHDRTKTRLAR